MENSSRRNSKDQDQRRKSSEKKDRRKSTDENKERRNSGAQDTGEGSGKKRHSHGHHDHNRRDSKKDGPEAGGRYTHIVTHVPADPQPRTAIPPPPPPVKVDEGHYHHNQRRVSKDRRPSAKPENNGGRKRHSHDHKKRHSQDHERRNSSQKDETQPQNKRASGDQEVTAAQAGPSKEKDTPNKLSLDPSVNKDSNKPGPSNPPVGEGRSLFDESTFVRGPDEVASDIGLPFAIFDENAEKMLEETKEDKELDEKLSEIMDGYRGELKKQARQGKKHRYPKYTYSDIVSMLTKQGIPVPADDDFARLEATHGAQWDPDGTIVEYYSPVLRSFIPINMRGRYRGCWAEDRCIQGLDITTLGPKPDALEGHIDRNRQIRIQEKYEVMGQVAIDTGHLDYLVEIQKYQVEILPIPILYEVLDLGMDTLNENLKVLAAEEGYPPQSRVYETTELQARHVRRKLQIYSGLGLEPLDSKRKGLGRVHPQWERTRDQVINSLLARRHQAKYILRLRQEKEARRHAEEQNEGDSTKNNGPDTVNLDNRVEGITGSKTNVTKPSPKNKPGNKVQDPSSKKNVQNSAAKK